MQKIQYGINKHIISINRQKLYQYLFPSVFLNHRFYKSVRNPDFIDTIFIYVRNMNYIGLSNNISTL